MSDIAERITTEPIESSYLLGIGYNAEKQILAVEFKAGPIFHHAPFSIDEMTAFYNATSKGAHYNKFIRGKVHGQKMTGECPKCGHKNGWLGTKCTDCGCANYADVQQSEK